MEPTSTAMPPPEQRDASQTRPAPKPRPGPAARRFGYLVAIAANLVGLYLIFVRPGWEVVPFLTEDTWDVLPIVTASLLVSIAVNLVWLVYDPRWMRPLGEVITSAVGVAVTGRVLSVFPFSFADGDPWEGLVRIVLVVGLIGCVIGVIVNLVTLIRYAANPPLEA